MLFVTINNILNICRKYLLYQRFWYLLSISMIKLFKFPSCNWEPFLYNITGTFQQDIPLIRGCTIRCGVSKRDVEKRFQAITRVPRSRIGWKFTFFVALWKTNMPWPKGEKRTERPRERCIERARERHRVRRFCVFVVAAQWSGQAEQWRSLNVP